MLPGTKRSAVLILGLAAGKGPFATFTWVISMLENTQRSIQASSQSEVESIQCSYEIAPLPE
jgi:hypothetical protein